MFQWLQRQPCIKPQRLEPLRLWQVGFESRSLRLNCVTCNLWRGTSIVVSKVACSLGTQGGKPTSNAKYPLSDHPLRTQQVNKLKINKIHITIGYASEYFKDAFSIFSKPPLFKVLILLSILNLFIKISFRKFLPFQVA